MNRYYMSEERISVSGDFRMLMIWMIMELIVEKKDSIIPFLLLNSVKPQSMDKVYTQTLELLIMSRVLKKKMKRLPMNLLKQLNA